MTQKGLHGVHVLMSLPIDRRGALQYAHLTFLPGTNQTLTGNHLTSRPANSIAGFFIVFEERVVSWRAFIIESKAARRVLQQSMQLTFPDTESTTSMKTW